MAGGLIGALRVTLSADTAAFTTGMKKAQGQAAASSSAIQKSLGGIKASVAGLAAGLSIGVFAGMAKQALDYASSLGELAQQTGTTVEQYQILARAALTNGVEQGKMDAALKKLNITLGQAQGGAKQAVQAFANLGISKEQLDSYERGGDAIPDVAEGVKNLATEAQKGAAANGVFGKSGSALLPTLEQGRDGYNEMASAATQAGLVTQEQADKADGAKDSIDLLAYSLRTNFSAAIVDLLPDIEALVRNLSQLIAFVVKGARSLAYFREHLNKTEGAIASYTRGTPEGRAKGRNQKMVAEENIARMEMEDATGLTLQGMLAKPKPRAPRGTETIDLSSGGGGRKKKSGADTAERERKDRLRDALQAADDVRRAELDELAARQDLVHDIKARADIEEQILGKQRDGELAQIDFNLAMGDINKTQADKQKAMAETLYGLRIEKLKQDEAFDQQQEVIKQRKAVADSTMEIAEMESRLAETAAERRKIELQILAAKFEQLRQAQQDIIDDERSSPEEKNAAGRRLMDLGTLQAGATTTTLRDTAGPLEQFLNSLPSTAAKANEALENIAANGLSSLVDGLTDAITGAKSLGDVFSSIAKQIIADLIRIQIQKAVVGSLGNVLSGGGGDLLGSIGGLLGGGYSGGNIDASLPNVIGMATGGSMKVGGNPGVDTNLLSINGVAVARVSQGEQINVSPENGGSGRGGGTTIVNMNGVITNDQFYAQLDARLAMTRQGAIVDTERRSIKRGQRRLGR